MYLSEKLAEYTVRTQYDALPAAVQQRAKVLVLDAIGCALGGAHGTPLDIAVAAFRRAPPTVGDLFLIGRTERLPLEEALLLNGMATRYLDFMDVYFSNDVCHPAENVPVALTCGASVGASGRQVIEAVVAGYEAQLWLCDLFSFHKAGFHHVSAAGLVAPLVLGKLLGAGAPELAHAVGIGGSMHLALAAISGGQISMAKAIGYGIGSAQSLLPLKLAMSGMTGPLGVIEWLLKQTAIGETARAESIQVDDRYRLLDVALKAFPVQFELQSVAEAGVALHKQVGADSGRIEKVEVRTLSKIASRTADPAKYDPNTRETADHSLPICLAMSLLHGHLTAEDFEADLWCEPRVKELVNRIVVKVDPELEGSGHTRAVTVEIELAGGRRLQKSVLTPRGDAARPLTKGETTEKFLELAVPVLGNDRARLLLEAILHLDAISDVRILGQLLCP